MPTHPRTVIIRCARCGLDLTPPLRLLEDLALLSNADGEPLLPRGTYLIANGDYYPRGVVVHLDDLRNTRHHPDPRRLNGCCGMDGCDGMNRVCANGHEVGTERSDCWWAHGIHFDPARVEVVAVAEAAGSRPACP